MKYNSKIGRKGMAKKDTNYAGYKEEMFRELQSEVELLKRENELLKKENATLESSYQQMREIHNTVLEEYKQGIADTREMRQHMQEVLRDSLVAKREYADRMNSLLESLRSSNEKYAGLNKNSK